MKRPVPVILTAILLGLLALGLGLTGSGMGFVAFMAFRKTIPPVPSPLPPAFIPVLFLLMAILCVALAIWFAVTMVDLVKLRSWARYSVLVIAGCMAVFSAFGAVTSALIPSMMAATPAAGPAPDPHIMHAIFLVAALIYGILTAIGVSLLIYYNLASTRALFAQPPALDLSPPNTSTGRPRPTAITLIAWLFMISGPYCAIFAFLPFPAFFFGFLLYGWASHLSFVLIGTFTFATGYGLLRLYNWARVAVIGWLGVGLGNFIVLVTPWGAARLHLFMDAMSARMAVPESQMPPPNLYANTGIFVFSAVFGLAFNVVILLLLHRHRNAFTPLPLPPLL